MADLKFVTIIFTLFSTHIIQGIEWTDVTITPYKPSGLKACVPDIPDLAKFTLCVNILPVAPNQRCDYQGSVFSKSNQWCITRKSNNSTRTWNNYKKMTETGEFVNTIEYTVTLIVNGETIKSPRLTKIIREEDFVTGENQNNIQKGCIRKQGTSTATPICSFPQTVIIINKSINILQTQLSDNNTVCEEKLTSAKEALEKVAVQFSEMSINLANLETAYDKSQTELAESQRFAKEAVNMIESSQGPRTNKLILNGTLILEPHLPILKELISYDIGIDQSSYKIISSEPITRKKVVFKLENYSQKVNIYLQSKIKLKHSKLQILDYDADINLNFN